MALALMAKAFKLNYSTPTNNNQTISSNPRNRQIAQPGMNMGQDRQIQMIGDNGGNQFRQYAGNLNGYNAVQNVGNQNQIRNGNIVAVRAEGNATGHNGNQIRCYNYRREEEGIQLQAEEYDLMAAAADLDEINEVNANCILMANLQQVSSSGTQTDSTLVYDSDGSAEVHEYENCYNNEIFNMFTQEEQYTELLEPIPEPQQVPQNDNNVISEKEEAGIQLQAEEYDLMAATADLDEIEKVNANCILMANLQQASSSGTQTDSAPVCDTDGSAENDNNVISKVTDMEQDEETVEQHSANFEETRALYESLY
nr:hypothetical protein [Tanacetum cinerariifolium]